ncbi:MAG: YncE family protein [Methylotetracoccus sp.]
MTKTNETRRSFGLLPLLLSLLAACAAPAACFAVAPDRTSAASTGPTTKRYVLKQFPSVATEGRADAPALPRKKPDSPKFLGVITGAGIYPRSIAVSEKRDKIYAISPYDGYVTIVDGKTRTVEGRVFTGNDPNYSVIDDRRDRLHVLSDGRSQVISIDTSTNKLVGTPIRIGDPHRPKGCNNFDIPCTDPGSDSYTIAMNHRTGKIYVGNIADKTVSVVDVEQRKLIRTIPIDASAYLIKVNETTNKVYVATGLFALMVVIDGDSDQVIKSTPIGFPGLPTNCYTTFGCEEWGSYSFNLAINERTNTIYASNFFSGDMIVVDGKTDRAIGSPIKIGRTANFLTVDESKNVIYVGNMDDATVTVVDGKTNRISGAPIILGEPAGPPGCILFECTEYSTTLVEMAINKTTQRLYVLDQQESGLINVLDSGIQRPITDPIKPRNIRISLHDLGLMQLVIHDIYNVDRGSAINAEDGRLHLSTVLDHGDANIANGGEPRNMENPATFTIAQRIGLEYLDLIRAGNTESAARAIVVERYLKNVKQTYERIFDVPFPRPSSTDDSRDLTGNLAFRTLHDLIPGQIWVNGVKKSILDPSLAGTPLSAKDMQQLSSPLDRVYDPELRDMENPMNGEHVDLLERDFSFAREFETRYTFGKLLSGQGDGDYDSFDLSSILMWKALSSAQGSPESLH